MKTKETYPLLASITLMIAVMVIFIVAASATGVKYAAEDAAANRSIEIIGSYSIDGGEWLPFTEDVKFYTDDYHTVVVKGNFSRGIPAGRSLLFFIPRMYVSLKIGGAEVYAFGEKEGGRAALKIAGTAWADYAPPVGISADTEIELTMRNAYRHTNVSFNALLGSMQTGSRAGLYERMFKGSGAMLEFGLFFIFFSVIALVLAAIAYFWRLPHAEKAVALAFFAVIGASNSLCDLNFLYMPLLIPNPVTASLFDIMPATLIMCVFFICAVTYASEKIHRPVKILTTAQCLLISALIALQFFGVMSLYETQPVTLPVFVAMHFIVIWFLLYDTFKHRNGRAGLFLLTMLPCIIGGTLDVGNYFFRVAPPRVFLAGGLGLTLILQAVHLAYMIKKSGEAALQKQKLETELAQSRISALISQIQPHFILNALVAIEELCLIDPNTAHEAVREFSIYLRGHVNALSTTKLIMFNDELFHVENYLALEKKRFGDRVKIVYDIAARDFMLPALTLQPIAENAVRHGLTKRDGGGTVTISTAETETGCVITVSDDGAGFDPNEIGRGGQAGVGIENVRLRLTSMCKGTLEVQSTPGVGTTVVITVPG